MKTALLLNSVSQAEYCVRHRLHEGCILFSTNPAVDIYLKAHHGIECRCVSQFLTHEDLISYRTQASNLADRVLASLDEDVAPFLNERFGLSMRYFTPLYSYLGKHYLLGQIAVVEAIRKIQASHSLEKIRYFNSRQQELLNVSPELTPLLGDFFPQLTKEPLDEPKVGARSADMRGLLKRVLGKIGDGRAWIKLVRRALRALRASSRRSPFNDRRKSLILFEPLYFLEFLQDSLEKYDVIRVLQSGYPEGYGWTIAKPRVEINRGQLETLMSKKGSEPYEELFRRSVREDFVSNAASYLEPVLFIKTIHERKPISLAVWGNIGGFVKYLSVEFLRSAGVTTVGTQHGTTYVDQVMPWTWESDFDRCDQFISWGFTKDDLARAFPDVSPRFEVHPIGAVLPQAPRSPKIDIDIVFPMMWSMTMYEGGPARIKPDSLMERQIMLLRHLNSLKGLKIYIKPLPRPTPNTCIALSLEGELKNLHIIDDMTYGDFLGKYNPKIVVLDYPGSTLYQSLPLDADILLMPDPMNPYEAVALKELEERVDICQDGAEAIAKLDLLLDGRLAKKRGEIYYRHYITRDGARENTVRLIEELINRPSSSPVAAQ